MPATVKRLPPKNAEAGAAEEGGGSVALTVFIYILLAALIAVIIYVLYRVIKNARSDSSDDARSFGSSVYNYDGMRKDDVSVSSEARKEASKKYANVGGNKHYYFQEKFEEDGKPTTGDRYTLVYLHMDGCGYCRKFDPVWEELKKKHAEELEKAGVYMESYESKSDEADKYYAGTGFPTVLLAKGGDTVATFEGQRTIPDILRFVASYTKFST